MPIITDPEHLKARAAWIGAEADRWMKHHAAAFAELEEGTTVIIDIVSGAYVTGTTRGAADDAYDWRFGPGERLSYTFTVGRPIFMGGGIWQKS